ncbi:MAG: type I methionyl aminopeptidase, partial [Gemmatimonadota bacterium]|nr:type I methionyl aminopeptidase [Gemmatimonadota bacterium]
MITLKSPRELESMSKAGSIVGGTLRLMHEVVRPGLTTEDLDRTAEEFIRSHDGAIPSFKGLYGFPKTLCVSIDQEIVHGIPDAKRVLKEGSVVSVDVGVQVDGLHADAATTIAVGEIDAEAQRLLDVTKECLAAGVAQARLGNHIGDIGHAVQKVAEAAGFGVVRELVGHDPRGQRPQNMFSCLLRRLRGAPLPRRRSCLCVPCASAVPPPNHSRRRPQPPSAALSRLQPPSAPAAFVNTLGPS